jgi:hypothetical protein
VAPLSAGFSVMVLTVSLSSHLSLRRCPSLKGKNGQEPSLPLRALLWPRVEKDPSQVSPRVWKHTYSYQVARGCTA